MENNTLLNGIVKDAQSEAERILLQAQEQIEQRRRALEDQIRRLEEESEKALSQHRETAERRSLSVIKTEERRIALRAREDLGKRVIKEAVRQMAESIGNPEYGELLSRWIAEGALGVNRPEALVKCSFKETVTDEILRRAEALILETTGRTVGLSVADGEPLSEQGVVVTSADNRVAFNNQVSTRLRRYEQDVKRIISEALNI